MTLRARALLGLVGVVAVSAVTTAIISSRQLRTRVEADYVRNLEREARLVASGISAAPRDLNIAAHRYGVLLERRVTFIDDAGTVVGDSDFDDRSLALLENHLDRPEVREALATGRGVARRISASTNREELKVAIAAWPGIVRISLPTRTLAEAVPRITTPIAVGAAAALVLGAAFFLALSHSVAAPLRSLIAGGTGDAVPRPPVRGPREVSAVVRAYRALGERMHERLNALSREREQTSTVIDALAEGVLAARADGTVVQINRAAREFLDLAQDEPVPPLNELFHEPDARAVVNRVRAGEMTTGGELEFRGRSLLITGRPLPTGGAVLGFIDMSESRRLQAIRRDFVANVSHELKTPLTSILGYAETLLSEGELAGMHRQFLQVIGDNAHRMQRLVDDLLDLARVESGAWAPDSITLGLVPIAREAWGAMGDRPETADVHIVYDVPDGVAVYGDRDAVHTILTNLFDNAVRHTPPGGTVTFSAAASGTMAEIAVADSGSGIAPEHIPRIFERFYRVDPGRSREEGGTGLGLSIVRHLVEAHGGRVKIASDVGKGTTVRLSLPRARQATP